MSGLSIRFKLTLWYSAVLVLLVGLTFLAVRQASGMVLRKTIRDYLISTVEANVDEIAYTPTQGGGAPTDIHIPFQDGFLRIDEDFMNAVNDVRTALYTADGVMLYGENPLAKQTDAIAFSESYTWSMSVNGTRYDLYDRRLGLALPSGDVLWIRGIVPESESVQQLKSITNISLLLLPFLILAAVVSGYFLAGRMLMPIRKMEKMAGRISQGSDLKQRLQLGPSRDEIHQLASVFNDMFQRLDSSFEAERQFTSDASHELRTPISVILAQCEYALGKDGTADDYRQALRVIRRQGARMTGLVNDMLDYTRMEQSAERYPLTEMDLSGAAAEIAEQMAILRTKDIELSSHIAPGLTVRGNHMLLSRLLQNLIGNAYRYGVQDGHISVTLEAGSHPETGRPCAVLSVSDDGIGIPEDEQNKIFDRFYRGDASRTERGTGLGLSMVKKIADIHQAEIRLQSRPAEGSTFSVYFPPNEPL